MIAKRCLVSGKVQGVFYRASTAERARALGLTGYAKNLADGRVEVLACGDEEKVEELIDWLWQGPPAAKVEGVDVQDANAAQAPTGFSTR
ncbi:MAG TPA: acylphosphatase [Gammaproteobacteria bacterium]|jgi:acylphosphatase